MESELVDAGVEPVRSGMGNEADISVLLEKEGGGRRGKRWGLCLTLD